MSSNDIKEKLEELTPQEKEKVLSILKEYGTTGKSESYDKLIDEDWNEKPVSIYQFLTDDNYLGQAWKDAEGKSKLYPAWKEVLEQLYPTGIDTKVNNLILSGARGLGKSEIAVTCMAYMMYRIMCMKNPLEYYHMKKTEKICFAFMNITLYLAEDIAISKFQKTIQMSPWFTQRCTMTQRNNQPYLVPPEPIDIIIGSQSSHVIGKGILCAFYDEISFVKNQDIDKQKKIATDMVDTSIGGMKTRFIHRGKNPTLLILASSKRSDKSFLEEHMKKSLENEKENLMIVDKAVWNIKPKGTYSNKTFRVAVGNKFLPSVIVPDEDTDEIWQKKGYSIIHPPIDFRKDFLDGIDRALCDFAGISTTGASKYISGARVMDCVKDSMKNPFVKEILEIGNAPDDNIQYYDFFDMNNVSDELMNKPLFIHLDMSISGDKTGIAGVFIKGKKPSTTEDQARDLFYSLAFSVSIKAPKGRQISFEKNRNFIRWLKKQGFNIKAITSDTFQSYDLQQQLKAEGYNCEILSVDKVDTDHVCKPYQYLKSTIYENRLEMHKNQTLIDELVNLERSESSGKVDHPDGGSKDISDATCGAIFEASKFAEEFAYSYGETYEATIKANDDTERRAQKQVIIDFEEELKRLNPFTEKAQELTKQQNKEIEEMNSRLGKGTQKRTTGMPFVL